LALVLAAPLGQAQVKLPAPQHTGAPPPVVAPGATPSLPGSGTPTLPATQADPSSTFTYFLVFVNNYTPQLRVELDALGGDYGALFVRKSQKPTWSEYDLKVDNTASGDETLILNSGSRPVLTSGLWWIGAYHQQGKPVDVDWFFDVVPSLKPGMGSVPYGAQGNLPPGTTFRVWAPFASAVAVAGTFNAWSSTATPLASEGNGNWSLDVRDLLPGARYKYVLKNGVNTLWRNDPRALDVTSSNGDTVIYDHKSYTWSDGGYSTPSWDDLVVYELHIGTFQDLPGSAVGNFDSARNKLDYLDSLGITAIELMPHFEFPGDYSWGYNPAHPFAVESAYGDANALKRFVDEAHDRGLAVFTDLVYNHLGPTDLDLWQFDGWSQNGYGGIYFYNDAKAITPWGDTRPDFGRPEVRQYLRDNLLLWLEDFHMDGMRWDSTSNIRMTNLGDNPDGWSLMQWCNDEVDGKQPWKYIFAEDLFNAPNDWITKPTGAGGAGFDGQWDALFVHPIRDAVIVPNDQRRDMWAVRNAILHKYNGDAFERIIYTESHDEVANGKSRVPEEIWPGNAASWFSKKRSTLAAAVLMTAPGVPMLFQGQEFLEDGYFSDQDPLDWNKSVTFGGLTQLYRDLIGLRRSLGGNTWGLKGQNTNVFHVNNVNKLIGYHRWRNGGPGDDVVVLANFSTNSWTNYTIGLPRAGTWRVRFNSDWNGYDPAFGNHPSFDVSAQAVPYDGLPYSASLSIGPYTALVLSQ
jgi:1,4-alpha-glucan branching enzyme